MAGPPESISATNRSPLVQLLTSLFLAIAVLALLVRLGTKYTRAGKLAIEDFLASAATLLVLGQSIAVISQCKNGLGKPQTSLSSDQLTREFKSQYVASALFILSITAAKLSYLASIRTLSSQLFQKISVAIGGFLVLWCVSSFFVTLFQCHLPQTWNILSSTCINRQSFWTIFSTVDIIGEVVLLGLLVTVVAKIKASVAKRALVICVFGNRAILLPAIITQLVLVNKETQSTDATFSPWKLSIANQVVLCLAITTICIPYLKPFLDSLESGQMRIDNTHQMQSGAASYARASSRQTAQSREKMSPKLNFASEDGSSQGSSSPRLA